MSGDDFNFVSTCTLCIFPDKNELTCFDYDLSSPDLARIVEV